MCFAIRIGEPESKALSLARLVLIGHLIDVVTVAFELWPGSSKIELCASHVLFSLRFCWV